MLGEGVLVPSKAAQREERPQEVRSMPGAPAPLQSRRRELLELSGGSSLCLEFVGCGRRWLLEQSLGQLDYVPRDNRAAYG